MPKLIKLILVGAPFAGKSTFVRMLKTGVFENNYLPTREVITTTFKFSTINTNEEFTFQILDLPICISDGSDRANIGHYREADCAIIMYDETSITSYCDTHKYYNRIKAFGDIPIAFVCNKSDEKIFGHSIKSSTEANVVGKTSKNRFVVSVLKNIGLEKPLKYLMERLVGKEVFFYTKERKWISQENNTNTNTNTNTNLPITDTPNPITNANTDFPLTDTPNPNKLKDDITNYFFKKISKNMIIIKGLPELVDDSLRKNLIEMLDKTFNNYGDIVNSYLPLDESKTLMLGTYIIQYDDEKNVEQAILKEDGARFDLLHVMQVSRFDFSQLAS